MVFTTLAMNQTVFFEALGRSLEDRGFRVAYICFHERSFEYLIARGGRAYNAFAPREDYAQRVDLRRYPWASLNLILSHEKAAFEVDDSMYLVRKLRNYLAVVEQVFDDLQKESERMVVVQELGGFLSILAAFYAARARGIDNFFLEPSFFRGRVFIVRNSFSALAVDGPVSERASPEVTAYLDEVRAKCNIVIPVKDRHHYRAARKKLMDRRNWVRLSQKLTDKYWHGKREEFGHIGGHVFRHLRMFINNQRLKTHYRLLSGVDRFVYYPLHVPADAALTLRSPEFLDQYALIDYISRAVPDSHKVVIKEHPALVGAVEYRRVRDLLRRRDNLVILDPHINNYEILRRADAVITVNSKAGAEGLLLGKPVIVLGNAFYTPCQLVHHPASLAELPGLLVKLLHQQPSISSESILRYFQDVWASSRRGEIYDPSRENIAALSEALLEAIA